MNGSAILQVMICEEAPERSSAGEFTRAYASHRFSKSISNRELRLAADAWDYPYEEWVPANDAKPERLPAMKWFRRRPEELRWDRWDLDCAIPIRCPMSQ